MCPFPSLIALVPDALRDASALSDAGIRNLTGRSFHLASVGAILMFLWGGSTMLVEEPMPPEVIAVEESQ